MADLEWYVVIINAPELVTLRQIAAAPRAANKGRYFEKYSPVRFIAVVITSAVVVSP